jgi:dipeptidyl aminopeptidase/acylaminoacyl peptidase
MMRISAAILAGVGIAGLTTESLAQTRQSSATDAKATDRLITAIANIRSAASPSYSPDGKHIAFISDQTGVPQVWVVSATGGLPLQLTSLSDPVQSVHWSPAGDWLAYDVAPGGGLNVQIYVMRPDGSQVKRLTAGGQDNNRLRGWTHDGKRIRAASAAANPAALQALLIDPQTGTFTPFGRAIGISRITDVSRDGRRAVVWRLAQRSDSNLFLVDLQSGAETLLTPHEGPGGVAPLVRTDFSLG